MAEELIIKFITDYIPLTEEEISIVKEQSLIVTYKKNTILLSEGEFAQYNYFILKGCVRSYYILDGDERTTDFYTENQSILPISIFNKQPSEYYLSCLEECTIALGSEERNQMLVQKIPKLASLIIQFNHEVMMQSQILFDTFKNFSPELRYLKFMELRPDLLNRVPQYHLATYLGVKPESLSRIRKRIMSNMGTK